MNSEHVFCEALDSDTIHETGVRLKTTIILLQNHYENTLQGAGTVTKKIMLDAKNYMKPNVTCVKCIKIQLVNQGLHE